VGLGRQQVEAPELLVDRQDLDVREASLGRISANGVGSDDGAGAGGISPCIPTGRQCSTQNP
jgi:hypothetical protein